MAYAGARFANSLLEAVVLGKTGISECTFVMSSVVPGLDYFSTVVEFGVSSFSFLFRTEARSHLNGVLFFEISFLPQAEGVSKIHPVPLLNDFEKKLLDAAIPELKANIQKGVDFVAAKKA
jgi:malate dehydrogenase